jgi:hypothetical protein
MSYPRPWRSKLARIKGVGRAATESLGGAAQALAKPVVIVNSCIGQETRT